MSSDQRCACLLLHGFCGTPFEMEPLLPHLKALGCTVEIPTLPGHGGGIAEFRRSFYPDWFAYAEERFLALAQNHAAVIPVGFSMGGSIALALAAKHAKRPQTKGVIALAPAYRAYGFFPFTRQASWLVLTPVLQYFRPEIPLPPPDPRSREIAPFKGNDHTLCLPQLHSLDRGLAAMRGLLPSLTCPVRILCDVGDAVCPPEAAARFARSVNSDDVLIRCLRMREQVTSHHMLTTHKETREIVARETATHVARFAAL